MREMGHPVDDRLDQANPELARGEHRVMTVLGDEVLPPTTDLDAPDGVRHRVQQAGGKAEKFGNCGDGASMWGHVVSLDVRYT